MTLVNLNLINILNLCIAVIFEFLLNILIIFRQLFKKPVLSKYRTVEIK